MVDFKKKLNVNAVRAGVAAGLALAGSASHAAGFDDILDAISISSFDTKIIAVGLVVVGIYLTMQGITVAKRVISKI